MSLMKFSEQKLITDICFLINQEIYGSDFDRSNLFIRVQFYNVFSNPETIATLSRQFTMKFSLILEFSRQCL